MDGLDFTPEDVYNVLSQAFPKQNDFGECNYTEELQELLDFNITSKAEFLDLIISHREEVLAIDAEDMDEMNIKWHTEHYGKEYVQERVKNKFWFALPGLMRITLELEFGDRYREYASKRDER